MRYRDQLKEARKWSYIEAGYSDELPPEERKAALEKANRLYEEAVAEIEEIELEEEENYSKHERKYKRHWNEAA